MKLSLDTGSIVRRKKCPNCKSRFVAIQHFVLNDSKPYAAAFIECHRHDEAEIFFTIIFGTWNTNDATDHLTFGCRYGRTENQEEMACTLVDIPASFDSPLAGKRLTRNEALKNPRLNEFWEVVDYLLETDKTIHDYLYHPRKSFLSTFFKV